ncbi:MAG: TonB-dependent receptor [Aureispira sp.]|nr:TonB-dependent receptor [Aureispira sp.]
MKAILIYICILAGVFNLQAQNSIKFSALVVSEEKEPLIGATVNWEGTTKSAVTDIDGWFTIDRIDTLKAYSLEINYVGYETAVVEILPNEDRLELIVQSNATIEQINVETTERSNFTSTLNPINMETLSACELGRAACCNLAESFENNGTVNVSFSDAVTGAREIEMLGLKGTYTQMMLEKRPMFNRLGRAYGLEYIPGTWVESIQISKGASTVRNGAQSITGLINVELLKPNKAPMFFINLFGNHLGRIELNTHLNFKLSEKWSTGVLLHGNYFNNAEDHNHDTFLDIPNRKQLNGVWRLHHKSDALHAEINVQGILDQRSSGQTDKGHDYHTGTNHDLYYLGADVRRIEAFGKVGYMGFKNPAQSIAVIYHGNVHEHKSFFGNRRYDALQRNGYANLIFQTNLVNDEHGLVAGLTYDIIDFKEQFNDINYDRTEHTASAYVEYDFSKKFNELRGNAFGLILGIRGDWLATQKFSKLYPSPRINLKYNFTDDIVIRASAGRGVRNPNVFVENLRYMPSNREFVLQETIMPEVAWNYGFNFTSNFKLLGQDANISLDAYRTDFENQLIADIDTRNDQLQLYNLQGKSFANSFLLAYTQNLISGLEMRLAYKFNDVRSTYNGVLNTQPLTPQHRGLAHLHYTTPEKDWDFNVTAQIVGPQRLPSVNGSTAGLPRYRKQATSPAYVLVNMHTTKYFKNGLEIYLGAENLTNYRQEAPILGYQDPFGNDKTGAYPQFDATSIFAPVMGIRVYGGVRYTFQPKEKTEKNRKPKNSNAVTQTITIKTSAQCGTCKGFIEGAFKNTKGIISVDLNPETQIFTAEYIEGKISVEKIKNKIAQVGYDADDVLGNQNAYEKLPACCKKGGHH